MHGRFVGVDSFPGWTHNPQTLNRYSYVGNNPLRFIDPSGNTPIDSDEYYGKCGPSCQDPKPTPPAGSAYGNEGELIKTDGSPYLPPETVDITADPIKVISDPAPPKKRRWWEKALAWLGIGGAATAGGGASAGAGAAAAFAGDGATRFLYDQPIYAPNGQLIGQGTVDLNPTFERIARGERDPHPNDGTEFRNREQILPPQPEGYYQEWVVRTPNYPQVGPQRLITGAGGEIWYTPNHYQTFTPINNAAVRCGCGPGPPSPP